MVDRGRLRKTIDSNESSSFGTERAEGILESLG
jgi:hypothetical protein